MDAKENELSDQLLNILKQISDFEYDLAKQSPLSDSIKTLNSQYEHFNEFIKDITKFLPGFHSVLDKSKMYSTSPGQTEKEVKSKEEIGNYCNEAKNKLDFVNEFFLISYFFFNFKKILNMPYTLGNKLILLKTPKTNLSNCTINISIKKREL